MRKTQTQRNKEHIARLRRKAQAYDYMVGKLALIVDLQEHGVQIEAWGLSSVITTTVNEATNIAKAVQE